MLIETIKNHPGGRGGEATLKMASLPGHTVDIPDVRALVAECRLINSRWIYRCDIVVRRLSTLAPCLAVLSYRSPPSALKVRRNQGYLSYQLLPEGSRRFEGLE